MITSIRTVSRIDVIFRIGVLTDSAFHARVFGQQCYHLAASPDYIRRHGMLGSPEELARHKCLVYRGSSGPNQWLLRRRGMGALPRLTPDVIE